MNNRHVTLMLLGCLAVLAGIAAVTLLDVPFNTVLWAGLILICPLSHLVMMKYISHGHGQASSHDEMHTGGDRNG
jgi:hypothetical protein